MKNNIYEYSDYKKYLIDLVGAMAFKGRGVKAKISKALRIHTAYVSQVFNNNAHFTLEQACELAEFLALSKSESHYFLLLVQKARAGSSKLEQYFLRQAEEYKEAQKQLKNRLEIDEEVPERDQSTYYSSWHYIAVHALTAVPEFQKKELISQRLNLPIEKVNEILEFLLKVGLLVRKGDTFILGPRDLHLSSEGPMINKHHTNWRFRAVDALDRPHPDDLHYSGVISIKKEDARMIKNILINSLKDIREVVKDSIEEEVYCYTLDMFAV